MRELLGILLALCFGGTLAWGLYTGSLPARGEDVSRAERPWSFWSTAATYTFLLLLSVLFASTP